MTVYVLCIEQMDAEGESWYEPEDVFATSERADEIGQKIVANYYGPFIPDYIIKEFEVRE